MLITAAGENVAPIPIETLVKEKIPIISNAVLVGDKAKFLSMLLTLKVPRAVPAPGGGTAGGRSSGSGSGSGLGSGMTRERAW